MQIAAQWQCGTQQRLQVVLQHRRPCVATHSMQRQRLEVYACSDLHADHAENLAWVQAHLRPRAVNDGGVQALTVLLVAGDISDRLSVIRYSRCSHIGVAEWGACLRALAVHAVHAGKLSHSAHAQGSADAPEGCILAGGFPTRQP